VHELEPRLIDRPRTHDIGLGNLQCVLQRAHIVGLGREIETAHTLVLIVEAIVLNPNNVRKSDGGLTEKFTLDELLTNVMIYWISNNVHSSMRYY